MKKLTGEQGRTLIRRARSVIDNRLGGKSSCESDDPALKERRGTFVTLKSRGHLRGCIGNIEPVKSIWDGISDNAISAAFHDYRFSGLRREELGDIQISVSVLSRPQKLAFSTTDELLQKLVPFQDGVILRKGGSASATFLPQVWEQLPNVEEFLSHLCLKAGLSQNCWREDDIDIEVYQTQSFNEEKE